MKKHSRAKARAVRRIKPGKAGKGKTIEIEVSSAEVERKLHKFLDAWREHIHDEIAVHKELLAGKQTLPGHLSATMRIHKKFLKELQKL